jgi:hypothetical protein
MSGSARVMSLTSLFPQHCSTRNRMASCSLLDVAGCLLSVCNAMVGSGDFVNRATTRCDISIVSVNVMILAGRAESSVAFVWRRHLACRGIMNWCELVGLRQVNQSCLMTGRHHNPNPAQREERLLHTVRERDKSSGSHCCSWLPAFSLICGKCPEICRSIPEPTKNFTTCFRRFSLS